MMQIGTVLQNRYTIERQIGAGGMGAVYLAVDQKFGSQVAIKQTFYQTRELREAFEREARLLNNLHHPVLPHVSDSFVENDGHFLVMEYIDGEDLSAVLKRDGAFPAAEVARWTLELLDALDYLHSQTTPIIHRDIKPNNLKITTRGNIVLLDFGLAKLENADASSEKSIFGYSRKYSPLEQIEGTGTDQRSDIFAVGATAYHLLVGKPPLDALRRAAQIIAGKPDPLELANEINPDIQPTVAAVVQQALALNPDLRFASAKLMRQSLEVALEPNNDALKTSETTVANPTNAQTAVVAPTDNFPALAAFAQDLAENNAPQPIEVRVTSANAPAHFTQSAVASEKSFAPENQSRVSNRLGSRLNLTIAAAVLCLAVLAGIYFYQQPNLAANSTETPAAEIPTGETVAATENKADSNSEPTPADAAPENVQPSASPVEKNNASAKSAAKSAAPEKEESDDEAATVKTANAKTRSSAVAKPDSAPVSKTAGSAQREPNAAAPPARPAPIIVRNAPRSTATRDRIEMDQPVSNIERVLTGDAENSSPRDQRLRRRAARQRRQSQTEQEAEILRRQRTEEILRRNRQPLPRNN